MQDACLICALRCFGPTVSACDPPMPETREDKTVVCHAGLSITIKALGRAVGFGTTLRERLRGDPLIPAATDNN